MILGWMPGSGNNLHIPTGQLDSDKPGHHLGSVSLTSKKPRTENQAQFAFYMDLLGHDIMNSNQAVLSYLELISSSPAADKKIRMFAEKAITHVRTSTVLVENVKRLIATNTLDPESLQPIDLLKTIERAQVELLRFYPGKKITIDFASKPAKAFASGNSYAADLILNVFVTAVRLDSGDDILMKLDLKEEKVNNKPAWVIRLEDKNAKLPPFMNGGGVAETYAQDISTAVKTTGMLFAKMVAKNLGGDFEAHPIYREAKKVGAVFTIVLRKVDGK